VPIVVAVIVFYVMIVWRRGRTILVRRTSAAAPDVARFIADTERAQVVRVPGTGVFLTSQPSGVPASLVHYRDHVRSLPERIVLLRVEFVHTPRVRIGECADVVEEAPRVYRITLRAGFMERPCLTDRLREAPATASLKLDAPDVTYFIGRETFLRTKAGEMGRFTESLFSFLYNVAASATIYFGLPPERVMEIGMHIDL
jgi:KUP system potassium uptake protein